MSQTQKSGVRDADRNDGAESPRPQPEQDEPKISDPELGDLSKRDYMAIYVRAAKKSIKDHIPNLAAALAYYAFLAIPALLLISVGVFGLVANKDAVGELVDRLGRSPRAEALTSSREPRRSPKSGGRADDVVVGSSWRSGRSPGRCRR